MVAGEVEEGGRGRISSERIIKRRSLSSVVLSADKARALNCLRFIATLKPRQRETQGARRIRKTSDFSDMTMLSSSLLILATIILIADHGKSYPHLIKIDDRIDRRSLLDERCRQCGFNEDCYDEPAGGCVNGVYKDKCGYINCFKGPGEHCDKSGKNKCAPNLLCKCNVCKGCQKNRLKVYQCFYGDDKMCLGDLASDEKF